MNCGVLYSIFLIFFILHQVICEDFYDLLGVSKQATVREIRKAFKKIAVAKHPDKNPDDPTAHDVFTKINRAYEVLKDEDLRKKYDMHGEDGLKEDGPSGRGFKSWNFYQHEFGIYDNDDDIITLSKSDFEASVANSNDVWFINYYSPNCGHCHELAPDWREMAQELEGVIRIGAVNCQDDWMLCRSQGIRSYPSLLLYPQREKFYGDRNTKELVKFALKQVRVEVRELWSGNFNSIISEEKDKPWLISFCGDGGDCLERMTLTKLSVMLSELVNVGVIDCHEKETKCSELGIEGGTYYFEAGGVKKGAGLEISSLYTKEVAFSVLAQLPDVTELNNDQFEKALTDLALGQDTPWLIHFVEGESRDVELRKLPALLKSVHIGRVDCRMSRTACNDLHIHKFPNFVVFKQGGGHEIHHGRHTAQDIANFARDSAQTPVRVLRPSDFPSPVTNSDTPWFVDFYAPWCPPCMRLLPEFRKASKEMSNRINFGTVDCTIHSVLCSSYNIRSYPTTILYNHTVPHHFHGNHAKQDLVEFLQDTLSPPVQILNDDSFAENLEHKDPEEMWLIDFYAPWCGPCQQLAPEWRRFAKMVKDRKNIHVAQVDCDAQRTLCQMQGVRSYPTIRLYPLGQSDPSTHHAFNGWFRDATSIRAWAFEFLPSKAVELNWDSFHSKVLQSPDPWIVDFYTPWCGHCQVFAPEFERLASAVEGQVHAGKVDCDKENFLCQQAGIRAYPSVRYYSGSPNKNPQGLIGEDINSQNADFIIQYLRQKTGGRQITQKHDEL